VDVEFRAAPDAALSVTGYNRVLKTVHWASLLPVIAAYGAVWMSRAAASREQSALLVQLHGSVGLTVFA
jgi:cytochrome b561